MCDWIRELLDFWFPKPVEQDMDGDIVPDIPQSAPDSAAYSGEVAISMDIPDVYKAEPAVREAERVVRSRS